jgi:hypothetical protein
MTSEDWEDFMWAVVTVIFGRATAQAVSCWLPTAAALVQTRVWSCGILWWTEVALGQVFSENFGFPCQSTFHLLLHNHLIITRGWHNRPGVAAVPITSQTPLPQKKPQWYLECVIPWDCYSHLNSQEIQYAVQKPTKSHSNYDNMVLGRQ